MRYCSQRSNQNINICFHPKKITYIYIYICIHVFTVIIVNFFKLINLRPAQYSLGLLRWIVNEIRNKNEISLRRQNTVVTNLYYNYMI